MVNLYRSMCPRFTQQSGRRPFGCTADASRRTASNATVGSEMLAARIYEVYAAVGVFFFVMRRGCPRRNVCGESNTRDGK